MDDKKLSFDRFTRAIANLRLDGKPPRPTAHTASVVDFTNWDAVRREVEAAAAGTDEPRR